MYFLDLNTLCDVFRLH